MRTGLNALSALSLCTALAFGLAACGGGGGGATATDTGGASTVTAQSPLPVGDPNCSTGGVKLDYGIDENRNGMLDTAEVDGSENICNGADGLTALINTTALVVGDSNCPYGGYEVESGLDLDKSGALENPNSNNDDEITSTSYLCNEAYRPLIADTISAGRIDLDWSGMAVDPSVAFSEVYKDRSWISSTADAATS